MKKVNFVSKLFICSIIYFCYNKKIYGKSEITEWSTFFGYSNKLQYYAWFNKYLENKIFHVRIPIFDISYLGLTENDIKDFSLLDNMFFIKKNDKYRLLKKEKEVNKKVVLRISKDEFPMEFILSKNAFKDTEGIQNLNECIERYIGNNSLLSKIRVLAIKHPFLKRILNIKTFDVEEEARYYFRMIRK